MATPKAFVNTQVLRYLKALLPDSANIRRGNVLAGVKEVCEEFTTALREQKREINRLRKANDALAQESIDQVEYIADLQAKLRAANTTDADTTEGELIGDDAPEPTGVDRDEDLDEPEDDDEEDEDADDE